MAKTAWIFSYKLKKNVTDEQFIELTQKLHDEVISKAKGLFLGSIICRTKLGRILCFGKLRRTPKMQRR